MVLEKLTKIIAEKLDIDASTITPETTAADLGMDSLDVAELLMDIEDNFGVTVEPSPELKTIGDFVKAIEALQ